MSFEIPQGLDLSQVPLAANPSGAPPNFIDPPSFAHLIYGLVDTLMAITILFVALRIMSTFNKKNSLKADDCTCHIRNCSRRDLNAD